MAQEFIEMDYDIISGGTDTHVVLMDLSIKAFPAKLQKKHLKKLVLQ